MAATTHVHTTHGRTSESRGGQRAAPVPWDAALAWVKTEKVPANQSNGRRDRNDGNKTQDKARDLTRGLSLSSLRRRPVLPLPFEGHCWVQQRKFFLCGVAGGGCGVSPVANLHVRPASSCLSRTALQLLHQSWTCVSVCASVCMGVWTRRTGHHCEDPSTNGNRTSRGRIGCQGLGRPEVVEPVERKSELRTANRLQLRGRGAMRRCCSADCSVCGRAHGKSVGKSVLEKVCWKMWVGKCGSENVCWKMCVGKSVLNAYRLRGICPTKSDMRGGISLMMLVGVFARPSSSRSAAFWQSLVGLVSDRGQLSPGGGRICLPIRAPGARGAGPWLRRTRLIPQFCSSLTIPGAWACHWSHTGRRAFQGAKMETDLQGCAKGQGLAEQADDACRVLWCSSHARPTEFVFVVVFSSLFRYSHGLTCQVRQLAVWHLHLFCSGTPLASRHLCSSLSINLAQSLRRQSFSPFLRLPSPPLFFSRVHRPCNPLHSEGWQTHGHGTRHRTEHDGRPARHSHQNSGAPSTFSLPWHGALSSCISQSLLDLVTRAHETAHRLRGTGGRGKSAEGLERREGGGGKAGPANAP